jgi:hypothetical protein
MKVQNTQTGQYGHVVDDIMGCCSEDEVPVVYDEATAFEGTDKTLLVSVPEIEPEPDLIRCGAGQGEECCIFLTVGGEGPCCERFTRLRNALLSRNMNAKRNPPEPWPECMKFPKRGE